MMKKSSGNIAETVRTLAEPIAESLGYFLWDVEFVKEGARRILRLTIDTESEEGITIDDCEKMHRAIDPVLDEADPIEEAYYLEVSSPGLERPLKRAGDFLRYAGRDVVVKLYAALDGQKEFCGRLIGRTDAGVRVDVNGEELLFPSESVAKVHLKADI